MESPLRAVRFVHHAIQVELEALEADARAGRFEGWIARAAYLRRLVELHGRGEENSVFADLAVAAPGVAESFLEEHAREQELFRASIDAARNGEHARATELWAELAAQIREHTRREEDEVVPLCERLFTLPEMASHVGRMMGSYPAGELRAAIPWIAAHLDPEERIAYVAMLRRVTPPDRFVATVAALRAGLGEDAFAEIAARLPRLG